MALSLHMRSLGHALLSVSFMLLFCGCLETQLTTTYINEEYGIGINPPVEWIQQEFTNDTWIIGWQPYSNSTTSFLISRPYRLDEGLSLSVFADDIEETYPEMYMNYSTLNRDWLTIRGLTAYDIEYSYSKNGTIWKEWQGAVKHTRDVYLLKFSSLLTNYDAYFSLVNESVATFQVK